MSVRSNNELNDKSSSGKSPNDKYYNNTLEAEHAPLVFLSKAQVLRKIPITAPTLWAWCRDPAKNFPKPRAISPNKVVWIEAEVDAWMRAQPIRTYKP
jgi:predicted DNA-binding transcriptional regulator AlpA